MTTLVWTAILTVIMEAVTCLFRFGLKLEATRDTAPLRHLTFGFRIHHGYIGLVLVAVALFFSVPEPWNRWLLRFGLALAISDLIHHFLVLWPITGDPQFHFRYPQE